MKTTTRPTPDPDDDIGGMVVVGYGCVSLLSLGMKQSIALACLSSNPIACPIRLPLRLTCVLILAVCGQSGLTI